MPDDKGRSVWDFLIEIDNKKKWISLVIYLTVVPSIAIFACALVIWSFFSPTFEIIGESGTIKFKASLFAESTYQMLVHPRGWQETGIKVCPNDILKIFTSGQTNIGPDFKTIIDNSVKIKERTDKVNNLINNGLSESDADKQINQIDIGATWNYPYGWPWTDSKGHNPLTPSKLKKIPSSFDIDKTIYWNKRSSGCLIGYISPNRDFLSELNTSNHKFDVSLFMDLSQKEVTIPANVHKDSYLYVAINDSSILQFKDDNFGFLMLTIKK